MEWIALISISTMCVCFIILAKKEIEITKLEEENRELKWDITCLEDNISTLRYDLSHYQYKFEQDLLKVESFNGQKKEYQVWLNDFILLDTEFNAGSIYSTVKMDFYNEFGEIVCHADMEISIKFLSGKTRLTLSTVGQEKASFLEQYFADNGIRLKVLEIL